MNQQDLTRRRWMGTLAAGAGAALYSSGPADGQEFEIRGASIRLGLASYSLIAFKRPEAIPMMKLSGTPFVNIKDVHMPLTSTPEQIDEARKEFTDAGLTIVGGGTIYFNKDDEADFRAKFEYAKRAGLPLMVIGGTRETLPKLEKYVKEYNIKIAVHNHGPSDKQFPTPQSALEILKNMDPRCGVCIDLGHTVRAGVDVVESIAAAGPRLFDMHVKDLRDFSERGKACDCGEGKMPFPEIFRQLIKMKYQGTANLEHEFDQKAPMTGILKSFAYMRGVLAGLRAA